MLTKHSELTQFLMPLLKSMGFHLWGIELTGQNKNLTLRIFIDNDENSISVDDCARVSQQVDAALAVEDRFNSHYLLEVSSPGLDRKFFSLKQMSSYIGKKVRIVSHTPINGRRKFSAILCSVQNDSITIEQDGEDLAIEECNLASVKLVFN